MLIAGLASILLYAASSAADSIIVTGRAIKDRQTSLAECLARRCPPNEDIDASLALAEAQLIAGKYREARITLLEALKRNKKEAMAYPIPVSDLYRANGRVAAHLGIDEDYYRSTWGIYNTLKRGMPNAKDLQYSAMMEVAEMMATTRGHDRAREYYRSIAYHARKDGRPDIAALAELRMILRHWPAYAREDAIQEIADSADPKTRAAQLEARLALARMAFERKDEAKGDAIVRELTRYDIKKPILVFAPQWAVQQAGGTAEGFASLGDRQGESAARQSSGVRGGAPDPLNVVASGAPNSVDSARMPLNVEDMWMDVGFEITREGKVSNVQVLRSHGDIGWGKALLASIAGRRYTPPRAASAQGYRMERYTYTSGLEEGTGTHQQQHSPNARVEYFDLSDISTPN